MHALPNQTFGATEILASSSFTRFLQYTAGRPDDAFEPFLHPFDAPPHPLNEQS
jgi:hypothetical protein